MTFLAREYSSGKTCGRHFQKIATTRGRVGDVNVLLAMRYGDHVHSERVDRWVSQLAAEYGRDRAIVATCPITELGFVRVSSGKAAYAESVDAARDDLEDLKSSMGMLLIPQETSAPLMVREPTYAELRGGSRGVEPR